MAIQYCRLTFAEREEISRGLRAGELFSSIASQLNRSTSTVTREVWRHTKVKLCYRAIPAHKRAENRNPGGRKSKIAVNEKLRDYIYKKLKIE